MKKERTLIIGASGTFGQELYKKYDSDKILFTFNKNFIKNGIKFDAINMNFEKTIKNLHEIKIAILLLAHKDINYCFKNKKYSNLINVIKIKEILNYLKKYNIKPIFLSTDFVFSGKKGNYTENDKPDPIVLYGKQKLEIENFIKANFNNYLIFRLSKTFSLKNGGTTPFYSWLSFFSKKKIYCATDQIYNPISIEDAAKIVFQISNKNLNGIFNLAGPESFSRYQIFKKLYKEYLKFKNKKVELINCKFNDLKENVEKWPLDTSMTVTKTIKHTNISFIRVDVAIKKTVQEYFRKSL